MKKLMVMLGLVAMAAGVQAATINWSSQSTLLCDSTGTALGAFATGTSVALIALDSVTDEWNAGTWKAAAGKVTEYMPGSITAMGSTKGKIAGSYGFQLTDQDAPVNGTILAMVFKDADGSYRQLAYYDAAKEGGIGSALIETATVSGLTDDTKDFTAAFGSASASKMLPTAAAVPEPTSAMLLLLGVAGMALRRRRA